MPTHHSTPPNKAQAAAASSPPPNRRATLAGLPSSIPTFLKQNWCFLGGSLIVLLIAYYLIAIGETGDYLVAVNKNRTVWRDNFFVVITRFSEVEAYLILIALLCLFRFRSAIFLVLTGATTGVLIAILKSAFGHARPLRYIFDNNEPLWYTLSRFDESFYNNSWAYTSFPSGHSAAAFALFGFVAFNAKRFKTPVAMCCLLIASLVAFSRIYLLMHFLKDVTVGATIGILIAALMFFLQFRLFPNHKGLDRGILNKFQ